MNIGYFTDVHARATTPEGRSDNFRDSIFSKMRSLKEIWKKHDVDFVVCGGDLFDSPEPPYSILNEMQNILKSWDRNIISAIGSHDYFGYQLRSFDRTALGNLHGGGIIKVLGLPGESNEIVLENSQLSVRIVFNNHTYWLEEKPEELSVKKNSENITIQVVHGSIVSKSVPYPHILCKNFKTESDIILCGHIHHPWSEEVDGGTFINPGSVGRLENTGEYRVPKVLIITIDENTHDISYVFDTIPGGIENPFNSKLEKTEVSQMQDINRFLSMISENKNVEIVDLKEQIPRIAEHFEFDSEVVDKAFELLERTKEG